MFFRIAIQTRRGSVQPGTSHSNRYKILEQNTEKMRLQNNIPQWNYLHKGYRIRKESKMKLLNGSYPSFKKSFCKIYSNPIKKLELLTQKQGVFKKKKSESTFRPEK